jgi:hypothetical protein
MRAVAYIDGGPLGTTRTFPARPFAGAAAAVRARGAAGRQDEQYATALAIAANRLGIQARLVFGATPSASGEVKGSDIHAWVEVHTADGTWAQQGSPPGPAPHSRTRRRRIAGGWTEVVDTRR